MTDTHRTPRGLPSFPPGTYLAPGLRVLRSLGAGGQGRVMLAEDERLRRHVAVKLLGGGHTETTAALADRIRAEGRTMARVRHPSVVQVFDVGEAAGEPYLVMEYVEGATLEERLRRQGPLDLSLALALLEQVGRGLEAVHDAGLAHGDLQPNNVLVDTELRARVVDFGLAFLSGGTAQYMAPELQEGTGSADVAVRQQADLYALGVLAHELIAGERPFDAPDRARVLAQHRHKAPPPLLSRRPDLDAALGRTVDQCLAKGPGARPGGAALVAEAFTAALQRLHRPALRRLLLVDDDPSFRQRVRVHVETLFPEVRVSEAGDGAEAIARCAAVPFDAVLFDLHMPGVNGVELAGALCADDGPRLLALTGRGSAADWALLRSLGVAALLAKPLQPEALRTELGRALYGE